MDPGDPGRIAGQANTGMTGFGAAGMTWSIVAHDPATGAFAVAVTTCSFAVGANCPYVRSGVGAVSTQSLTNRYLGPAVLDAMERGLAPAEAIEVRARPR